MGTSFSKIGKVYPFLDTENKLVKIVVAVGTVTVVYRVLVWASKSANLLDL